MNKYAFLFVTTLNVAIAAEPAQPIPSQLFGLSLGKIYDIGDLEIENNGNIPVKRSTGINKFLGEGIGYYFEPKKIYNEFPYVEKKNQKATNILQHRFGLTYFQSYQTT